MGHAFGMIMIHDVYWCVRAVHSVACTGSVTNSPQWLCLPYIIVGACWNFCKRSSLIWTFKCSLESFIVFSFLVLSVAYQRISTMASRYKSQGVVFETFTGSCVIGGLPSVLTKKVFTTVVAKSTCFVVLWPAVEVAHGIRMAWHYHLTKPCQVRLSVCILMIPWCSAFDLSSFFTWMSS